MKTTLLYLYSCLFLHFFATLPLSAQTNWTWTPLEPMPIAVSNNAVVAAQVNGADYVYSFGGIDTSKVSAGILQTAMKYEVASGEWSFIPNLPDTTGKIASAGSEVGGILYIIGGYHVFDSAPFERSSDRVHRFDPTTDTYLSDGAPIPVPIDDQVQVVWRDSLIISVTGWSDTENVPAVQIYDPANDSWQIGTSVPANPLYEAFGSSGSIVGDTIYYYGGAADGSFGATTRLRKGVIDPSNPTNISWTFIGYGPGLPAYRPASVSVGDKVYWIGGSSISYNYDGIAYNGSGGVPPLSRILEYDALSGEYDEGLGQDQAVMDLRGIGELSNGTFIIAGGMEEGQVVSDKTYLLEYSPLFVAEDAMPRALTISPSYLEMGTKVVVEFERGPVDLSVALIDIGGKRTPLYFESLPKQIILSIPDSLANGQYLIEVQSGGIPFSARLVVAR